MCNLTQFVVSVPVIDIHAHELARHLFQDILLKVGMCGLIVVDAGSTFCGVFADACAHSLEYVFTQLLAATTKLSVSSASSDT